MYQGLNKKQLLPKHTGNGKTRQTFCNAAAYKRLAMAVKTNRMQHVLLIMPCMSNAGLWF